MNNLLKKYLYLILIICVLNCYTPAIAIQYSDANLQQGFEYFSKKNYKSGLVCAKKVIKSNPESYHGYCLLGLCYGASGNIEYAERAFEKAVAIDPNNWKAYSFLGDTERAKHNYPVAIEYYNKVIQMKTTPDNVKAYFKKVVEETIKSQNTLYASQSDLKSIKNSVTLNLDWDHWTKKFEAGDAKNWIIEYSLKSQKAIDYKWTKLVTVQYIANASLPPKKCYEKYISSMKKTARNNKKSFNYNLICETQNDIIYEFDYNNGQESTISRIVRTPKGLYLLHYAQKSIITDKRKEKWIKILKNAKINE